VTRDDIPTPALLLDLDRLERNLRRMAAHVQRHSKNLRPHAKTHKCPEIARRQIAAGARGVACAKLGEAEVMARAGIHGVLITTEIVAPAAIRRLMRLVAEAPDTLIVVDNADNVAALGREAGGGVRVREWPGGGGPGARLPAEFALARRVVATVRRVRTRHRALVGAGRTAFSCHTPFPPEAVARPGIEYAFAGDEHGRLTITDP